MTAGVVAGCGGGGGSDTTHPSYTGRYVGSFTGTDSEVPGGEKGTFILTVNASGAATVQIASFASADTIVATGNVGENGTLNNLTGTVEGGGHTYTFTGTVTNNHGVLSASGTWTSTHGAGTWSGAPAPASNPYAGDYVGSFADGATVDLTVNTDCTVDGEITLPATLQSRGGAVRNHKASHVGIVDPATGRISWSVAFSPSGGVELDVLRAISGTIDLIAGDAQAQGIEVSADRELLRQIQLEMERNQTFTKELTKVVNNSGTAISNGQGGVIYTGGTGVGDFGDGGFSQGFLTFDTSVIPATAQIVEAKWRITQDSTTGNPFGFGSLSAEPVTFTDRAPIGTGALANGAVLVSNTLVNGVRDLDVTNLMNARPNKSKFQLRLRFPTNSNADAQSDRVNLTSGTLTIKYR